MKIKQYTWDIVDSNSWLIVENNCGLLVDAVDNQSLYDEIMLLDELTVVLTHAHFDHIIGLNTIREQKPDTIVISTIRCSEYIGNKYRNMSSAATAFMQFYDNGKNGDVVINPFTCDPSDKTFEEEYRFEWQGHSVCLKSVYGHSDDGLIAIIDDNVFSGDTLLNISTITRFPTGNKERFWNEDIPVLKSLTSDMVYPGHGVAGKREDMLFSEIKRYETIK